MERTLKISEKYRLKALACEKTAHEATDAAARAAWSELAVEWHALAFETAEHEKDRDLD